MLNGYSQETFIPVVMEELYVANRSGLVANMLATEKSFFQDELAKMFWTHCQQMKTNDLIGAAQSGSYL